MEIADIFAVNKADREGAGRLVKNLLNTLHDRPSSGWNVPVIQTIASTRSGIDELAKLINDHLNQKSENIHNKELTYTRALRLVQNQLLKKVDLNRFKADLEDQQGKSGFNIYRFITSWLS